MAKRKFQELCPVCGFPIYRDDAQSFYMRPEDKPTQDIVATHKRCVAPDTWEHIADDDEDLV